MDIHSRVVVNENVFSQEVDGEIVLLDMESENYFGLDEIGAAFWQLLQSHEILQDVLERLLEMYDVEEAVLQKDLESFVKRLDENGLVRIEDA
jgi:hypothetical protein